MTEEKEVGSDVSGSSDRERVFMDPSSGSVGVEELGVPPLPT